MGDRSGAGRGVLRRLLSPWAEAAKWLERAPRRLATALDVGEVESLEEDLGAVIAAEATISILLYENL